MRVLIILAIVAALLAFAGWITFGSGPDRASINLETNEIRQDTQEIVRSGAELLDKAGGELRQAENDGARGEPATGQ